MNEPVLKRDVGMTGALLLGLGSILGTGVFVSLGLGAGLAGDRTLLALLAAACLAAANGLASARLAAKIPTSGGTYEFATRLLHPTVGFVAGWAFLSAKGASAAVAGMGIAGYVLHPLGIDDPVLRGGLAAAIVLVLTALAASGLKRSNRVNATMVGVTILSLGGLVLFGAVRGEPAAVPAAGAPDLDDFLRATALLFVAFTGYGRVATLGEEIRDPARSIPRAVVITVATSLMIYLGVAWIALRTLGADRFGALVSETAAPLETVATTLGMSGWVPVLALGAFTAMVGVLLNLLLGLSRVVLAMARRGDLPPALQVLDTAGTSPRRAVWAVGIVVAAVAASGRSEVAWSFSALTVTLYYAITQLAGWRLARGPSDHVVSALGSAGCLLLSFSIPAPWWIAAGAGFGLGFALRFTSRRLPRGNPDR